jgi:hypothetical protein
MCIKSVQSPVKDGFCWALLSLSHGDEGEVPALHGLAQLSCILLNVLGRGVAREQDKEDGRGTAWQRRTYTHHSGDGAFSPT